MSLIDILYEAVEEVGGVQLAGVIGTDGLGVEMLIADEDIEPYREEVEMELAELASAASATVQRLGAGTVYDVIVEAEDLTYLISMVIPGYYAVLGMRNGNLGRARFAVHQMVGRLQSEL